MPAMPTIGLHASHEQFPPAELLDLAGRATAAGFDAVMCSDHFHPWSEAQGQSGHAWTWLGASMARNAVPHGVVNAPAGRYHPAVIAQAAATLASLFPGRFWMAAGSGEALNESITGETWPAKPERNERLREAVEVMRALWRGEMVDREGLVTVRHARLYSRPPAPPQVFVAALTPETARWGAGWADGLITTSMERAKQQAIADAFREGGGKGKPMLLQVKLSWDPDENRALEGALAQWRTNVLPPALSENLDTPQAYEWAARDVDAAAVGRAVRVAADLRRHVEWLRGDLAMGFTRLYLHNVNRGQAAFVDAFARGVLPVLRRG
jgi:coenzyme F420-dependent glucose-6-phosphate dehydrogenase